MKVKANAYYRLASIAIALSAYAGNEANPDAIELAPLPMPVEFKSDMYRRASSAAWGTPARGATPHCDTEFATLLRMVGHDMKTTDYLDTGHLNYQVPPGWWIDNN